MQRTRFAPRDRCYFTTRFRADGFTNLDGAPLMGNPLGGHHQAPLTIKAARWCGVDRSIARQHHGTKRGRINYR